MATVQNTMALQDKMTPVLSKIIKSMNSVMTAMEKTNTAANKGITSKAFKAARTDIQAADNALKTMNNDMKKTQSSQTKVKKGFSGWQTAIITANQAVQLIQQGIEKFNQFADLADTYTQTNARLGLITNSQEEQVGLQEKIYQSAQRSRVAYDDTASSVAKLGLLAGEAFNNNDEIVGFSELLSKSFAVAGASTEEMSSGMYQLTQAMAAGKLQGDEFRSVMENAPLVAQAIADYTGKTKGELKEMSAEGAITADIIKNAMFAASEDIEGKFANMPMTWSQSMTKISNTAQQKFAPLFEKFSSFINSPQFESFANMAVGAVSFIADAIMGLISVIGQIGIWFQNNWDIIYPILIGIATVIAGILIPQLIKWGIEALMSGIKAAASFAMAHWQLLLVAAAIAAMIILWQNFGEIGKIIAAIIGVIIAAVIIFNIVSAANPLGIILLIVIGIILVLIGVLVLLANYASDIFGFIGGLIYATGAVFYNIGMGIANFGIEVAESVVNAFLKLKYYVQFAFYKVKEFVLKVLIAIVKGAQGMIDTVLKGISSFINKIIGMVNTLISGINAIAGLFGMELSTIGEVNLQTTGDWSSGLQSSLDNLEAPELETVSYDRFEYKNIGESWNAGQESGRALGESVESGLGEIQDKISGLFGDLTNAMTVDETGTDLGALDTSGLDIGVGANMDPNGLGTSDGSGSSGGPRGTGETSISGGKLDEVGKLGSDVTISDEDLKYLKDIAKIDYINKYTTLRPTMSVSFGDVHENADTNKIMSAIEDMTEQALASALAH